MNSDLDLPADTNTQPAPDGTTPPLGSLTIQCAAGYTGFYLAKCFADATWGLAVGGCGSGEQDLRVVEDRFTSAFLAHSASLSLSVTRRTVSIHAVGCAWVGKCCFIC